ncbi:MAG: phosphate regulatory protein [Promethearchaeota archaeon CR_4]|nr:MAG: phosphate regulatory protein [Candidatus Lokiarchaeota archaeon CR_4]
MEKHTRKLIKWGSSETLIMSLPRRWVKTNNLTEKDEVQVIYNPDNSLLVLPPLNPAQSEKINVEIQVKEESDQNTIWYELITRYLDGADSISLITKKRFSPEFASQIRKMISTLLGLEILKVESQKIEVTDIMNIQETNIENLVKLISDYTLEFSFSTLSNFKSKNYDNLKEALSIRELVKKYYNRIHRELRKSLTNPSTLIKMNFNTQDVLDFAFFITSVNEVTENLELQINSTLDLRLPKETGRVFDFMEEICALLKSAIDAFLFKNTKEAIRVLEKHAEMQKWKREIENEEDKIAIQNKSSALQIILDSSEKISDSTRNISLTALRHAI